jgi:hypothetical protein
MHARSVIDSDGNHQRLANVYLEAIPSQIIIRNSYGFSYAPRFVNPAMQVVRVSPLLDLVSATCILSPEDR